MVASLYPMAMIIIGGLTLVIYNGIAEDTKKARQDRVAQDIQAYERRQKIKKIQREQDPQKVDNVDHTKLWMGD